MTSVKCIVKVAGPVSAAVTAIVMHKGKLGVVLPAEHLGHLTVCLAIYSSAVLSSEQVRTVTVERA